MTQRIDETARAVLLTLLSCGPRPGGWEERRALAYEAYQLARVMEGVRAELVEMERVMTRPEEPCVAARPKWWTPIVARIQHWVDGRMVA